MLSNCANSNCGKPFLRLREGKLFVVMTHPAQQATGKLQARALERYWLCNECAAVWTLVYNPEKGVRLVPLPRPVAGVPGGKTAAHGGAA